jgi:AraC-like DNA-binding protein
MSGNYTQDKFIFKVALESYPEEVIYIPEGKLFFRCTLPFNPDGSIKKIERGNRNNILGSYLNNLILLNPNKSEQQFINFMVRINKDYCRIPLEEKEIIKMVKTTYSKKEQLEPIGISLRKYWIDPNAPDKIKILQKYRKTQSIDKLEQFFSDEMANLEGKITLKTISQYTGLSERTVERRLSSEMKQIIEQHNQQIKLNKPKRKRY